MNSRTGNRAAMSRGICSDRRGGWADTLMFSGTAVAAGSGAAAAATTLKVSGWGGTAAVHGADFDRFALEVIAAGGDPVALATLQVYGQTFTVVGQLLRKADGTTIPYVAGGALAYDPATDTLVLRTDGTAGTLSIAGEKFAPAVGEEFPSLSLTASDGTKWTIRGSVQDFTKPDYAAMRAQAPPVMVALDKANAYLDTRRSPSGGWLIGSGFGPEVVDEAQGIAGIGTGYFQLSSNSSWPSAVRARPSGLLIAYGRTAGWSCRWCSGWPPNR